MGCIGIYMVDVYDFIKRNLCSLVYYLLDFLNKEL